jgi:long-chain fatty acid transport protein
MRRGGKGFSCVVLVGLACLLSCPQWALGSGFALYESGTRANALGSTLVGRADDPSAVFFNPAGITQLPGLQFMGGSIFIAPTTDVKTKGNILNPFSKQEATNSVDGHVWLPPHLYMTYQINNSLWFGFGLFTPFGLGTEFDGDWPGRFNSYKAIIQSLNINPNIAWKINDQLSVAVGLDVMWFDLELRQKIPVQLPGVFTEVDQRLNGDSFGFGCNAAVRYQPFDWLAFGLSYRSQVTQDVEGQADFTKDLTLPGFFRDTAANGSITLPDTIFMGVTFYPSKDLSIEVGAFWTNWSTFDQLTINYDTPIIPAAGGRSAVSSVTREKKWHDTWRIHGGVEYKVNEWLDLRTGYEYDMEPSPDKHVDYLVPANDRHLFGFGPGIHWAGWNVDMSYMYLLITDRNVEARPSEGILESEFRGGNAHLVGFSLSRKF